MWAIAAAAFVAIYFFQAPFPLIIISAALVGLAGGKFSPRFFSVRAEHDAESLALENGELPAHTRPSVARTLKICAISLPLWWVPVVLAGILLGTQHTIYQEGLFFSKAAMVTFGGAYAVLPYVSQQAVETYHWLSAGQMLDGLGLAETTPGPLIMVLQFVGFLGGWNHPGDLPPLLAATLGALITTWTTFVPCFLWIFLGAPYIEQLRGNQSLSTALSTVTAAVVGVIVNLAVWFGFHVLFPAGTVDWFGVTICVIAFFGILRWKWNVIPVVLGSGFAGLVYKFVFSGA
jgi:chromate transporter